MSSLWNDRVVRFTRHAALALSVLTAGGCADAAPQAEIEEETAALHGAKSALLARAYAAFGGLDALLSAERFEYRSHGSRNILGEGYRAGDGAIHTADFSAWVRSDTLGERVRIERALETEYPLPFSHAYTEIVTAQGGYIDGLDNLFGIPARSMLADRSAATRRQHLLLHPHLLLREVASGERAVLGLRAGRHGALELVLADEVAPLHLHFERGGELVELTSYESAPLLRDVPLAVEYSDYRRDEPGSALPREVVLFLNGEPIHHETRSEVRWNPALADELFAFPAPTQPEDGELAQRGRVMHQWYEQFVSAGVPLDGLQDQVVASEIAPGVFHLTGGSHHSLAVVQEAGIVLAEAPLHPERSEAVLAWLQERFPGRSVSHVVSSHHHADHSAGLRTFVALGAQVVMGEDSVPFFRKEVFRGASELIPDRLSATRTRARLLPVASAGSATLPDPERPVVAQHIATVHARDMLITYLPRQRLLFVSDVFSPQGPFNPIWARELREALRTLQLDVAFLVGAHGAGLATVEELDAQLAAK